MGIKGLTKPLTGDRQFCRSSNPNPKIRISISNHRRRCPMSSFVVSPQTYLKTSSVLSAHHQLPATSRRRVSMLCWEQWHCPYVVYKVRAMMEPVEGTVAKGCRSVLESEARSRPLLCPQNEQEPLSYIRIESEAERLSPSIASGLEELYHNYPLAVLKSGNPNAGKILVSNASKILLSNMATDETPTLGYVAMSMLC